MEGRSFVQFKYLNGISFISFIPPSSAVISRVILLSALSNHLFNDFFSATTTFASSALKYIVEGKARNQAIEEKRRIKTE